MKVELTPTEATNVRQALAYTLRRANPWLFDSEQVDSLREVENRLADATDEALSR